MKFDPLILFLIIFVFFILPSVLKRIRMKKRADKISDTSAMWETTDMSSMETAVTKMDTLKTGNENLSIIGKIASQIRQILREAEKRTKEQKQLQQNKQLSRRETHNQTGQGKQNGKEQDTIWDIPAEKTDDNFYESDIIISQDKSTQKKPESEKFKNKPEKFGYSEEKISLLKKSFSTEKRKRMHAVSDLPDKKYRFKTNPLQNAVILSEILSKPVAMKRPFFSEDFQRLP